MWTRGVHELAVDCKETHFKQFIHHPFCSYSSSCYQGSEIKDCLMNVQVEGKVSVLAGLATASAKYHRKNESSNKREVVSLTASLYARKGFLIADAEKTTCLDKGMAFNVEGIEIGMEEILIVTTEFESDNKRTEKSFEVKVRVLFFTISAKMKSLSQNSRVKGFVQIDHYSSKAGKWKRENYEAEHYEEAMKKVLEIENNMSKIPGVVDKTMYDKLHRMRYLVTLLPHSSDKISLFLELQNTITVLQLRLAKLKACEAETSDEAKRIEHLLTKLQGINIKDVSWSTLDCEKYLK